MNKDYEKAKIEYAIKKFNEGSFSLQQLFIFAMDLGELKAVTTLSGIRDSDSCECDNCHRTRKFIKKYEHLIKLKHTDGICQKCRPNIIEEELCFCRKIPCECPNLMSTKNKIEEIVEEL